MSHPYQEFVQDVASRSGLEDREEVERAIRATLTVLGERLRRVDAMAVAAQLPPELGAHLTSEACASGEQLEATSERLLDRICERTGLTERQATALFRVLAGTLDEQGRAQLRMQPLGALSMH